MSKRRARRRKGKRINPGAQVVEAPAARRERLKRLRRNKGTGSWWCWYCRVWNKGDKCLGCEQPREACE